MERSFSITVPFFKYRTIFITWGFENIKCRGRSKRSKDIEWSKISGALPKPERLHFSPVPTCVSRCICNSTKLLKIKHVKKNHPWFYYFDEQPDLSQTHSNSGDEQETTQIMENTKKSVACFDITCTRGKEFNKWLVGSGGGCKTQRQAQQAIRESSKYLRCCLEDDEEEELSWDIVDFCLISTGFIFKLVDAMQTEWGLGHAGRLGYFGAISDLIDFRKIHGTSSETVLRNLASTNVYLKRARKIVAKMMRLQCTN